MRVLLRQDVGPSGHGGARDDSLRGAVRSDDRVVCRHQQHRLRATEPEAVRRAAVDGRHHTEDVRGEVARGSSEVR